MSNKTPKKLLDLSSALVMAPPLLEKTVKYGVKNTHK